jgi:hypothetical protein
VLKQHFFLSVLNPLFPWEHTIYHILPNLLINFSFACMFLQTDQKLHEGRSHIRYKKLGLSL